MKLVETQSKTVLGLTTLLHRLRKKLRIRSCPMLLKKYAVERNTSLTWKKCTSATAVATTMSEMKSSRSSERTACVSSRMRWTYPGSSRECATMRLCLATSWLRDRDSFSNSTISTWSTQTLTSSPLTRPKLCSHVTLTKKITKQKLSVSTLWSRF